MEFSSLISTWKNKIISEKEKKWYHRTSKKLLNFFSRFLRTISLKRPLVACDKWWLFMPLRASIKGIIVRSFCCCWILFNARTLWQCMCKQLMPLRISISLYTSSWMIYCFAEMMSLLFSIKPLTQPHLSPLCFYSQLI